MTQEEKDLALRLYEHLLKNDSKLLELCFVTADRCVVAAKAFYGKIGERDEEDRQIEVAQERIQIELEKAEEQQIRESRRRNRKVNSWYVVYEKGIKWKRDYVSVYLVSSHYTGLYKVFVGKFTSYHRPEMKDVCVYSLNQKDYDYLMNNHNDSKNRSKELNAKTYEEFLEYLKECPSAKKEQIQGLFKWGDNVKFL